MAAYYALDYLAALTRLLASSNCVLPENCKSSVSKDECVIEPVWFHAQENSAFVDIRRCASFVEHGLRGTRIWWTGEKGRAEASGAEQLASTKLFQGRDHVSDRDGTARPARDRSRSAVFLPTNAELLAVEIPQLERALEERVLKFRSVSR